jgi:hypothetical protein
LSNSINKSIFVTEDGDVFFAVRTGLLNIIQFRVTVFWNLETATVRMRFQVLTAVSVKMARFWVAVLYGLEGAYRRFSGICCLHHQRWRQQAPLKRRRTSTTKIRLQNPEDSHLHKNLSFGMNLFILIKF